MLAPTPEFLSLQQAIAGRFSLERELGRGGMGVVFLARDIALERPVAIKLLPPAVASQDEVRERFLREARTAASLSHPNVVPIHLVEQHGDLVFFVMQFVDGETLGQRVRRGGPLTSLQATRLLQEVAWALAYAHSRGVVHRDVKPDNILIDKDSGRAMVTDFGIARVAGTLTMSGAGEMVGTANYMSPEQATGAEVDGRSDLFSLGVTMYFALTDTLPFDGPHLPAIVHSIVHNEVTPIAAARPDLPAALGNAIDRCLRKEAAARFASGEELAVAISHTPAGVQLAPELRYLIKATEGLSGAAGWASVGMLLLPDLVRNLSEREDILGVTVFIGIFAVPLILTAADTFRTVQQVARAGLGPADVRRALARTELERREELIAMNRSPDEFTSRMRRRQRIWLWLGHVSLGVGSLLLPAGLAMDGPFRRGVVIGSLLAIGLFTPLLYGGAWVLHRQKQRILRGEQKSLLTSTERLLKTRALDWLFRVTGFGRGSVTQNAPPAAERTEVMLADAAGSLFKALPDTLRGRFAAVPDVVARLEADARILRERIERHHRAADQPLDGDADMARSRLSTAVAALETIRLDLMRLVAGLGSADDLTADLERAREVSRAIDAEIAGRREVERLLSPMASTQRTR